MSYKDQPEELSIPKNRGLMWGLRILGVFLFGVAWVADAGRIAWGFVVLYFLFLFVVSLMNQAKKES